MMPLAIALFTVLALFMAAGGIPLPDHAQLVIFRTPVFQLLAAALALLCIAACARYGRAWRRVPFWLAHMGAVVILLGAALGSRLAVRGQLVLPVTADHAVDALPPEQDGGSIALGFQLSVADFKVEYYRPTYDLYRATVPQPMSADDYVHEAQCTLGEDDMLRGPATIPPIGRRALWDTIQNDWTQQLILEDGRILQRGQRTPRLFEAVLSVRHNAESHQHVLRVNAPATINGWRIYLESYGTEPRPYVQLQLRRDPGRRWVIAGIWLVIVGTAWLCWRGAPRGVQHA